MNSSNKNYKTLENVLEKVQYLSTISERLLMIPDMDTNNIQYHFENINPTELTKEISGCAGAVDGKNIQVEMEVADNINVSGKKELLSRLF